MTSRFLAPLTAALGFVGVALGAFGAHGLEDSISPRRLDVWQTAVHYQLFHVLALLVLTLVPGVANRGTVVVAAWLLVAGILVFSGTLYGLVLLDWPVLGMITPLGGLMLLGGWGLLFLVLLRRGES